MGCFLSRCNEASSVSSLNSSSSLDSSGSSNLSLIFTPKNASITRHCPPVIRKKTKRTLSV